MAALEDLLAKARRPLLLIGGSRWNDEARAQIARFAERFALPVATSYRRAPLFDQTRPNYAGDLGLLANPKLVARIKASDLVIVGGRASQPDHKPGLRAVRCQRICSRDKSWCMPIPKPASSCRVFRAELPIHASPRAFAAALDKITPRAEPGWRGETEAANADYRAFSDNACHCWADAGIERHDDLAAPTFVRGHHHYQRRGRICPPGFTASTVSAISAPISRQCRQSMGYGVPAAVALKRLYPTRRVVSISGDGDFLMSGQEFVTAAQYGLPINALELDNGMYGSIRLHQEKTYPGRVSATTLQNPDFALWAKSCGGFGVTVTRTEDFAEAFLAAEASNLPALIHVKIRCRRRGAGRNLKRGSRAGPHRQLTSLPHSVFPALRSRPRASARSRSWLRPGV